MFAAIVSPTVRLYYRHKSVKSCSINPQQFTTDPHSINLDTTIFLTEINKSRKKLPKHKSIKHFLRFSFVLDRLKNGNLFSSIPVCIDRSGVHSLLHFKSQTKLYNAMYNRMNHSLQKNKDLI